MDSAIWVALIGLGGILVTAFLGRAAASKTVKATTEKDAAVREAEERQKLVDSYKEALAAERAENASLRRENSDLRKAIP